MGIDETIEYLKGMFKGRQARADLLCPNCGGEWLDLNMTYGSCAGCKMGFVVKRTKECVGVYSINIYPTDEKQNVIPWDSWISENQQRIMAEHYEKSKNFWRKLG